MKKAFVMFTFLLALVTMSGVAQADSPRKPQATAAYGRHLSNGNYVWGYYCPIGYRLVYGQYVTYQLIWNGYGYAYAPVVSYGAFCTWP